jgi:hypothetical protein
VRRRRRVRRHIDIQQRARWARSRTSPLLIDNTSTAPWSTIVGVAGDTFAGHQDDPKSPALFQALAQARASFVYIVARTAGPPMALTQPVREVVASLNADSRFTGCNRSTWRSRIGCVSFACSAPCS